MPKTNKRWNPRYLSGCIQHALKLLPTDGGAIDLFRDAADNLECNNADDCRAYRRELNEGISRLRRRRRLEPWEHWLLSAAEQLLQPAPGTKHRAVTMLCSSIDEYNFEFGTGFRQWHDQHAIEEPAYL